MELETTSFLDRHVPDLAVLALLFLLALGVGADFDSARSHELHRLLYDGPRVHSYPGKIRILFGFLALHLAVVQTYALARWLWVKLLVMRLAADAQRRTASWS